MGLLKRLVWLAVVGLVVMGQPVSAQIPGLPRPRVEVPLPGLDDLIRQLTSEDPPLTSTLAESYVAVPWLDRWEPTLRSVEGLTRGDGGQWRLPRGAAYQLDLQSFCLKAGTHGPGNDGRGYLAAPLLGAKAAPIRAIMANWSAHPDVPQRDVQVLLWAIIARQPLNEMPASLRRTAARLLPRDQLAALGGRAIPDIPDSVWRQIERRVDSALLPALRAERALRRQLSRATSDYAQIERIAVLRGQPGGDPGPPIPEGRWSLHPAGYLVRYFPESYPDCRVQVVAPMPYQLVRDAQGRIASLGWADGLRIETSYNDVAGSLEVPGRPGMRAWAYAAIRFIRPNPAQPAEEQVREFIGRGWTLVGGGPQPGVRRGSEPGVRFTFLDDLGDIAGRVEQAQGHLDTVGDLVGRLGGDPDFDAVGDLTDLGHYRDGLEAALGDSMLDRGEWITDHLGRVVNAWNYASDMLGGVRDSLDDTMDFDGTDALAMPARNGRQRLGLSNNLR